MHFTRRGALRLGHDAVALLQPKQALFRRCRLFFQFGQPSRMGKVPGADALNTLDPCPVDQLFGRALLAGRARVMGMNMKISDVFFLTGHGSVFLWGGRRSLQLTKHYQLLPVAVKGENGRTDRSRPARGANDLIKEKTFE